MAISTLSFRFAPAHKLVRFEYLLLGDLRLALSEPPTPESRREISAILDLLFELLPARFQMEEAGGYLADVTRRFPNWQEQVDSLRIDHAILYENLRDLRKAIDGEPVSQRAARRLNDKIGEWMHRLRNHEREERRLSQLVMNLEIGGEGN